MSPTRHIEPPATIGIDLIDEQHRNLHRMVEEFETAFDAQASPALLVERLSQIYQYSVIHFETEEDLIERILPETLAQHRAGHARTLDGLRACIVAYKRNGTRIPTAVRHELRALVLGHTGEDDAALAAALRARDDA